MTQRDYLTVADAFELHRRGVDRHGGAHGVRDMGALEAALFRAQSGYYDDIVWEACALLESLAINHPLLDRNKRIAFAAMYAFLRINGWVIDGNAMKIYRKMIAFFESGTFQLDKLETLFRPLIRQI